MLFNVGRVPAFVKHSVQFNGIALFTFDTHISADIQGRMDVEFADSDLAKVETEEAAQLRLPVAVIKAARRKLTVLRAAPDERALHNWKSLHYEKLKGDRAGQRSIRLNDQWRMVFLLKEKAKGQAITVIAIEDYH